MLFAPTLLIYWPKEKRSGRPGILCGARAFTAQSTEVLQDCAPLMESTLFQYTEEGHCLAPRSVPVPFPLVP